jgi:hypothetical protein
MSNQLFQVGDKVESGHDDDFDTGRVIDADESAEAIRHADDAVYVAWQSGVRTWTPVDLLRHAE